MKTDLKMKRMFIHSCRYVWRWDVLQSGHESKSNNVESNESINHQPISAGNNLWASFLSIERPFTTLNMINVTQSLWSEIKKGSKATEFEFFTWFVAAGLGETKNYYNHYERYKRKRW